MIETILPYILSALTIYTMFLAGEKKKNAWLIGLTNQALWLSYIFMIQAWGLLPMNIALWFVYGRNHWKWTKEDRKSKAYCTCGHEILQDLRTKVYEAGTHTNMICAECNVQTSWDLDAPVPIRLDTFMAKEIK